MIYFITSYFLQAEFGQQLKTCDAIIVMYSLTDRISFHVAREILDDLANLGSVVCPVLLLANKMDLCQHRKVNLKKIKNFQSSAYTNPTNFLVKLISKHGLRTPNEGINQRYLKNWADEYALAVPKNLGVGVNFRPCSEGYFLSGRP